jgi:ABC-type branched-subunit amino acid transport system substrate-binding protein
LIKEKNLKRGAALVWDGYFGVQFAHGIQNALKEQQIVFDLNVMETPQNSTPGGGEVQRLLHGNPEIIFIFHSEPGAAFVVKQLRALRYSGQIVLQSSMLQTYDSKVRATFSGALQVKFPLNEPKFQRLHSLLKEKQGEDVADDFVFSYDGFRALLSEAALCGSAQGPSFEACLTNRLRNETWREGASGQFRFMRDGSTERPMVFKTITEGGFK